MQWAFITHKERERERERERGREREREREKEEERDQIGDHKEYIMTYCSKSLLSSRRK